MSLRGETATRMFEGYRLAFPNVFPLPGYKNVYDNPKHVMPDGRTVAKWLPTKEVPNYRITTAPVGVEGTFSFMLEEYYKEPIVSELHNYPMASQVQNKDKTYTYRYSLLNAAQFPSCCGVVRANYFSRANDDMSPLMIALFQHWIWQCGYTYALGILALQKEWEKVFKASPDSIQLIGSDKSRRTGSQLNLYKIYAVQPTY